jgi:hypothetical protein
MITCLNCGKVYHGKYCSECGQKATVTRLTWKSLAEEISHFFTHAEHSFVYTSKRLITDPGAVMKDFLNGKRKLIHKPITFLIIWAAVDRIILAFFEYCRDHFNLYTFKDTSPAFRILWNGAINPKIAAYENWITIVIQAPLLVLIGWLIFRKTKTSFVERWVIILYGISVTFMLAIAMRTVTFLMRLAHVPVSRGNINDGYFVAYQILITWIVYDFLRTYRPEMPGYQRIMLSFFAALLANYASDIAFYLMYRFSA